MVLMYNELFHIKNEAYLTEVRKARFSDIGTKERHKKYGGVYIAIKENTQEMVEVRVSNFIDALEFAGLVDKDQKNALATFNWDYTIGITMSHSHTIRNYDGLGGMTTDERNEYCGRCRDFTTKAIKHLGGHAPMIISLCHIIVSDDVEWHIEVYRKRERALIAACDALCRFYDGNK